MCEHMCMSQVDVGTVAFYAFTILVVDINWTSRAAACFTLLCWTKLFYFLKVHNPPALPHPTLHPPPLWLGRDLTDVCRVVLP